MTFNEFIEKVKRFIGIDGLLHAFCCLLVVELISIFAPIWVGAIIALLVGIAKEVYDKITDKGSAEWRDLICDCIGILIAVAIVLLLRI